MSGKRYPVRIPRFAAGIRAQESHVGSCRSWWSKAWTRRLEAMGLAGRLGRGKKYAMSGQVIELRIQGPHIEAKVVGTRSEPDVVKLDFRVPEGEARERIVAMMREEPIPTGDELGAAFEQFLADRLPPTAQDEPQ